MCPAGTYGNHPLRYNCSTCIEGYYCPAGTIGPFINPCPVGYYCPAGVAAAVSPVNLFHLFIISSKMPLPFCKLVNGIPGEPEMIFHFQKFIQILFTDERSSIPPFFLFNYGHWKYR